MILSQLTSYYHHQSCTYELNLGTTHRHPYQSLHLVGGKLPGNHWGQLQQIGLCTIESMACAISEESAFARSYDE